MNFTIENHAADRVILLTAAPGFSIRQEVESAITEVRAILHDTPEPCCLIMDIREASQSIDDVVVGANAFARGDSPLLRHPQMRCLIAVVDQPLVKFASRGLDSDIFGHVRVQVCSTLDEAWEAARV